MRSLVAFTATWLVALSLGFAGQAEADPRIGEVAPPLEVMTTEGNIARRTDGRVTIVDFFATWCEPCQRALAKLDTLARRYDRVAIIVVDVGEPPELVKAFFLAHPPPPAARIALDRDGAVSARWGQHRLPTTFVLDGAGVIRFINRGYGEGYGARVEARVRALLVE